MPESPLFWPVHELVGAYRSGTLSPVDVAKEALHRVERYDRELHAYLSVTDALLLEQADAAAAAYARGETAPLLGVPVAVKDAFHVAGAVTTLGSLLHTGQVARHDSGVVRRLRAAGAMFVGKTNTSEFCQSATTDNRLGPDTANPWDTAYTAGGSSGGSAMAAAAGLASVAVGSDGGGSIRIPAAFTGAVGVKPTYGRCPDEHGFRTMSDFACPGPLTRTVADARLVLEVLTGERLGCAASRRLRVGWCRRPGGAPVDPGVAALAERAAGMLADLGHQVAEVELPVDGWEELFAPLVLAEEHRERGHLLELAGDRLTEYERRTLRAGRELAPAAVAAAVDGVARFRGRVAEVFGTVDVVVCPATAVPAFPLRERPHAVDGEPVRWLWGAFPFTAPFNVAGTPVATLPCGLVDGMPVGVQLVAAAGADSLLLSVAEDLEAALAFDRSTLVDRWRDSLLAESG